MLETINANQTSDTLIEKRPTFYYLPLKKHLILQVPLNGHFSKICTYAHYCCP